MNTIAFEGQQSDETILAHLRQEAIVKYALIAVLFVFSLGFIIISAGITQYFPLMKEIVILVGIGLSLITFLIGYWWISVMFKKTVCYITDRRIIRFEPTTPFVVTKRSIAWNDALKAKGYTKNVLTRILGIGTVVVETQAQDQEDIVFNNVIYYEDIANYIDKILYFVKNNPSELKTLQPFIKKPRGERY